MFRRYVSPACAALCFLFAIAPLAHAVLPGELVPSFGSNGVARFGFDVPGQSPVDSGRTILMQGGSPLNPGSGKLLVAGLAGKHVGIARLSYTTGQLDPSFGNGGKALSTRFNVASYGGMVQMPNGDIVIGYADDYLGPDDDSKDFFIEVFDADGQPKNIGGDEVPNQRWVDLSTGASDCNRRFRENTAARLVLTPEGGIVLLGTVAVYDANDDTFYTRVAAWAEFNGGTYAPARPGYDECESAGGGATGAMDSLQAAVSANPRNVYVVGRNFAPVGDSYVLAGFQGLVPLDGSITSAYATALPDGYWRNRESELFQVRYEPERNGQLLEFGEADNGLVGGTVRRSPIIATASGTAIAPLWFFAGGSASDTSLGVRDGQRIFGSDSLVLLASARDCTAANACASDFNSFAIGLSTGQVVLNAYVPDARFGSGGWARRRIENYSGVNASRAQAFGLLVSGGVSFAQDTEAFVVGEFKANNLVASGDVDVFVARLRLANGDDGIFVPADVIFRNGLD